MNLQLTADKKNVVILPDSPLEYKKLSSFAGLLKNHDTFYFPSKINVSHILVERLKAEFKAVTLSESLQNILGTPFKLPQIPPDFNFITPPLDFQTIALRYLMAVDNGGLLLDPGMGKSKVVLDWIALKKFPRSCIVCPKPLLFVWEDEINKHRPDKSFHIVTTTDVDVEIPLILSKDITIINYSKVVLMRHALEKCGFTFIHLDEFLIKDPSSQRTEGITRLSEIIQYKCGGSGTLVNNTIEDMFAPVRYLERALVGSYVGNFRDRYCVFSPPRKDKADKRKFVVGYKNHPEAKAILESCCIVMTKEKWLKLPKKVFHEISVEPSEYQLKTYYDLASNYVCKVGEKFVEVETPLVMLLKLHQISNGFLYSEIEQHPENELFCKPVSSNKKRDTYFFEQQPKIEALRKLLTETLPSKRAILWFNMDAEFTLIKQLLDELKIPFISVRGGEKKTGEKVRLFNSDTTYKLGVFQAKSVNYGITVLGTDEESTDPGSTLLSFDPEICTEIFYSINFSLEVLLQQQDRIHRIGQKHECHYYFLYLNTPSELALKKAMETKMTLRRDTLVDIAESLRLKPNSEEVCGIS